MKKTTHKKPMAKKVKTQKQEPKRVEIKKVAAIKQPETEKVMAVEKKEPVKQQAVASEKVTTSKSDEVLKKLTTPEKKVSFLHTTFYLFALGALFAVGLLVYLTQSSNTSMHRNYQFVKQRLTNCYNQSGKYRNEIKKLKNDIEQLHISMSEPKCPAPQDRHEILNPEEYAPYEKGGSAVIEGDLCFTLEDGVKKCFDRAQVFINPVTSYSDEWYHRGWAGREALKVPDERAVKMNKMTLSDKDGKFKFEGLAAGSYYVGAIACVPKKSTDPNCVLSRYAAKVSMKNRVKAKLKRVYP